MCLCSCTNNICTHFFPANNSKSGSHGWITIPTLHFSWWLSITKVNSVFVNIQTFNSRYLKWQCNTSHHEHLASLSRYSRTSALISIQSKPFYHTQLDTAWQLQSQMLEIMAPVKQASSKTHFPCSQHSTNLYIKKDLPLEIAVEHLQGVKWRSTQLLLCGKKLYTATTNMWLHTANHLSYFDKYLTQIF